MERIKGIRLRMKAKRRRMLSAKKKMNIFWKSSELVKASSSASATDTTGAEAMNNSSENSIPGFIFLCNKKTKPRCFQYQVFGLPMGQKETVEKIKPGTKLFLFDYGMRLLHGIYEAVSEGQAKLEPRAFDGNFLAQVKFRIVKECLPIPERYFKSAILENYDQAGRLRLELSEQQVDTLESLFRPLSSSSSSDHLVDQASSNAASPEPLQQSALRIMEDQYHKNLSRLHSLPRVDPQPPIRPVQIMQHQQPRTGAFVDHVHPNFQHHSISNPIDLYNAPSQELYSTRGQTLVVQEPYPRYMISEQEWLPWNQTTGLGNDYHPWPLTREPHQQEIDAWYHQQLMRENVRTGDNFAAFTSMATNHNTLSTMQPPYAPAYGSPDQGLSYLVSGRVPYVSSTMQPYAPDRNPHPSPAAPYVTMQPHASSSSRIPVPNSVPLSSHFSFAGANNQFIN